MNGKNHTARNAVGFAGSTRFSRNIERRLASTFNHLEHVKDTGFRAESCSPLCCAILKTQPIWLILEWRKRIARSGTWLTSLALPCGLGFGGSSYSLEGFVQGLKSAFNYSEQVDYTGCPVESQTPCAAFDRPVPITSKRLARRTDRWQRCTERT
jgi:hypothetical protein